MANAIGLAMQISASTSSLASGISEADRLISKLGQGAVAAGKQFDSFRDSSGALPAVMQSLVDQAGFLADAFRGGAATSQEFKDGIAEVAASASEVSALFQAGAATTAQYATEEERAAQALAAVEQQYAAGAISLETYGRAKADLTGETAAAAAAEREASAALAASAAEVAKAEQEAAAITAKYTTEAERKAAALERVTAQYEAGRISEETFQRATEDLTGATAAAAQQEQEMASLRQRAASITEQVATPTERYAKTVGELDALLERGLISQETYNRALEQARTNLDRAAAAADGFGKKAGDAADSSMKFNELSGILGLLPGPLGGISARISSAASAAEGLGKVFGGGLSGAVSQVGQAFAFLTTPLGQVAAGLVAAGAAAAAVIANVSALADRVEKLNNISIKTGASFEFLQVLGEAAERSGSSIDAAGMSLTRLARKMDDAKNGSKEAIKGFERIGLSTEDLAKMSPEEVFKKMSAELSKMEDPAARSGIAMDLLGRSGAELLPTIMSLADSGPDMQRFFAILSGFDKVRLEGVDAAFEKLKTSGDGLTNSLTLPFAGMVDSVTTGLAELIGGITAITKPIGQFLEPLFTGIGRLVEVIGMAFGTIGRNIGAALAPLGEFGATMSQLFDPINEGLVDLLGYLFEVSTSVTEFIVSWSPLALINDAIQLAAGLVTEFGSAASAAFEPVIDVVGRVGAIFEAVFGKIGAYVSEFASNVAGNFVVIVEAFLEFTGVGQVVSAVADSIGQAFSSAWEIIKGVVGTIGGLIEDILTFAEDWLGIAKDVEEPVVATVEIETPAVEIAKSTGAVFYAEMDKATKKAAEFGQEGVAASLAYQKSLEDINALVQDGELDQEAQKRAVAQATAEFDRQIASLEQQKKAREDAAKVAEDAAKRQADADKKIADAAIEANRAQAEFGGNKAQQKASEDLVAIDRERARVEQEIAAARDASDQAAIAAANQRLAALDQARAAVAETAQFGFNQADVDKAINDVADKIDKDISQFEIDLDPQAADEFFDNIEDLKQQLNDKLIDPKQFETAAAEAKKQFETITSVVDKVFGSFSEADFAIAPDAADALFSRMEELKQQFKDGVIDEKQFERAAGTLKKGFEDAKKQAEDIAKLEEKYAEEAAKIEEERIRELSKTSSESLKATDLRTSEGASELLRLASGREDPAIEEYRKQVKKLDEIKKEIAKIGQQPVEIL